MTATPLTPAEIDECEAAAKKLHDKINDDFNLWLSLGTALPRLLAEVKANKARCAKLDDFGKRFATHHDGCAVLEASPLSFSDTICNCGYDDALNALKDGP